MDKLTEEEAIKLLEDWAAAKSTVNRLESELKDFMSGRKEKLDSAGGTATVTCRSKIDYQAIAHVMNLKGDILKPYTSEVIDYKKASEDVGIPKAILEQFKSPGMPSVSFKLKGGS